MKSINLASVILALLLNTSAFGQFIYSEDKLLSNDKEVVISSYKTHSEGLRFRFAGENTKRIKTVINVAPDPKKAFTAKNSMVLTEMVRRNKEGADDYYLALVEPRASFEVPEYMDRPMYFESDEFNVLAEFLVDSVKMEDPFFQSLYITSFMLYLLEAERFSEDQMQNYYRGLFHLNEIDSIHFYKNELDGEYNTKTLGNILPNSIIVESKMKEDRNLFVQKMKTGNDVVIFSSLPFTQSGKPAVQKFMMSVKKGLLYTDTRFLEEGDEVLINRDDLTIFKIKAGKKEKEAIQAGKEFREKGTY